MSGEMALPGYNSGAESCGGRSLFDPSRSKQPNSPRNMAACCAHFQERGHFLWMTAEGLNLEQEMRGPREAGPVRQKVLLQAQSGAKEAHGSV
eukprot:3074868-Rhodomonas_salina.1